MRAKKHPKCACGRASCVAVNGVRVCWICNLRVGKPVRPMTKRQIEKLREKHHA